METIRSILHHRDDLSDGEITELFEDARAAISDGEDPEEVLADLFGLELDFIYDDELAIFGRH